MIFYPRNQNLGLGDCSRLQQLDIPRNILLLLASLEPMKGIDIFWRGTTLRISMEPLLKQWPEDKRRSNDDRHCRLDSGKNVQICAAVGQVFEIYDAGIISS